MTTIARFGLIAALLIFVVPAPGEAMLRRLQVNPVNAHVFEVIGRGGTNGVEYWCSAADHAQRVLRAPWTARLYIARSLGPSVTTNRRSAVQFTLDPEAAGVTPSSPSLSINALRTGDSMSVQQAHSYCMAPMRRF